MFYKYKKNEFVSVVVFQNCDLIIALIDLKGNAYKTIKCEDETVYNYFLEVFNL